MSFALPTMVALILEFHYVPGLLSPPFSGLQTSKSLSEGQERHRSEPFLYDG